MSSNLHEISSALAQRAESVCRYYLPNGYRSGRYWIVGDAMNTRGRSMFVRLTGPSSGKGAAGKWTDAATGQHGDLLDVIRLSHGLAISAAGQEARWFLGRLPSLAMCAHSIQRPSAPAGSPDAARRLWTISQPILGTRAETYLHQRGITALHDATCLRFHSRCYYRLDRGPTETWPAMIAAVTDLRGHVTGVHRTWLDPSGFDPVTLGKAPISTQRKAMGGLFGHAVRFGAVDDVATAGEGIETMKSLQMVVPTMPMLAALSAVHLAAILFPVTLRRLYIARDDDRAGDAARDSLIERAREAGIDAIPLSPTLGDFNDDLRLLGVDALRAAVRVQLDPCDVARFMLPADLVR